MDEPDSLTGKQDKPLAPAIPPASVESSSQSIISTQATPVKRHQPHWQFIHTLWKSALERWPELKPWEEWFKLEWEGLKRGLILFLFLLAFPIIVATACITYKWESHIFTTTLGQTNQFYAGSNSFLLGQIKGQTEIANTIQKQFDDYKRDTESANQALKTDFNEIKREQDAKITELTSEKESAQNRLSFFEANPEKLAGIYSNIFTQVPTNFQQFNLVFERFNAAVSNITDFETTEMQLQRDRMTNGIKTITVTNTIIKEANTLDLLHKRSLSIDSIDSIKKNLDEAIHVPIKIYCIMGDQEAYSLGSQINAIFKNSGFNVDISSAIWGKPVEGFFLVCKTPPTGKLAEAFFQIFAELKVLPKVSIETNSSDSEIIVVVGSNKD